MIEVRPKPSSRRLEDRRWTFEELAKELPESNLPTELWDGELVVCPAPSFPHQKIVFRFRKILDAFVTGHQLGETVCAPIDMVLSARRATQPDVLFVSAARMNIVHQRIMGAADLVAEVISPDSRRRDRIDKRDLYKQYGVKEYWIIDPEAQTVEVLFLEAGQYRLIGRWQPGEKAKSRLLKGLIVEVDQIFGKSG